LPYHDVGKDKHRRMGTTFNPKGYHMEAPSEETLQRCKQQLEAKGLKVIIGG
jgi:pyruvate formate lyase activating enzyme